MGKGYVMNHLGHTVIFILLYCINGKGVINQPSSKIVWLEGWEEWELFFNGLDKEC